MTTCEYLAFDLRIHSKYGEIVSKIEEMFKGKEFENPDLESDEYFWEFGGDISDDSDDVIENAFILCLGLDAVEGNLNVDTESIEAPCLKRWTLNSKLFYQDDKWVGGGHRRIIMAGKKEWVSLDISKGEYKVLNHLLSKFSPDAERYAQEHKISLNISLLKYRLAMAKEHEQIFFSDDDNED